VNFKVKSRMKVDIEQIESICEGDVEYRILQVLGKSSLAVTIPKKWVKSLGLKPGDIVQLKLAGPSIIIKPVSTELGKEKRQVNLHVDSSDIDKIMRRLISMYLSGVDTIKVILSKKASGIKSVIKSKIKCKLPGVEIVEETSDTIIIKFMISIEELPIKKLINRISNIVSSMFREGLEVLKSTSSTLNSIYIEDLALRDDEVDRLYLLIYRLVNYGVINQKILPKLELNDPRELISSLIVAKLIERCGDHALRIAHLSYSLRIRESILISTNLINEVSKLGELVLTVHKDAVSSFINSDVGKAMNVLDRRSELRKTSIEIISNICKVCTQLSDFSKLVLMMESIRRFLLYSYDIAEVTLDTYTTI